MRASENIVKVGARVTVLGFIVLFLGILLTMTQDSSNTQAGGLIMLGPIPIAFGSSPEITTNILGIGLLLMIIYLFLWKMQR
ncbi:MAG: DUF131 domain-containing protein [Methanosarcinaceae archaeon]|nr:DUF131 domain-containing protein [Methanosarcinaceae archaeon]